jgi:hypothetical protein
MRLNQNVPVARFDLDKTAVTNDPYFFSVFLVTDVLLYSGGSPLYHFTNHSGQNRQCQHSDPFRSAHQLYRENHPQGREEQNR